MAENHLAHHVQISVDVFVPHADYAPTTLRHIGVASPVISDLVVGRVRRAVHFNDKTRGYASEVRNVRPDRMLTAEMSAVLGFQPQPGPEHHLRLCHVLAQALDVRP